jgi:hypothetical protein
MYSRRNPSYSEKKTKMRGKKSIGNAAVHENLRDKDARLSEMKVEIIMHIYFG